MNQGGKKQQQKNQKQIKQTNKQDAGSGKKLNKMPDSLTSRTTDRRDERDLNKQWLIN